MITLILTILLQLQNIPVSFLTVEAGKKVIHTIEVNDKMERKASFGEHGEFDLQLIRKDSTTVYFNTLDSYFSPNSYNIQGYKGEKRDVYLFHIGEASELRGEQNDGRFWRHKRIRNIVIGYSNVPSREIDKFDAIIDSLRISYINFKEIQACNSIKKRSDLNDYISLVAYMEEENALGIKENIVCPNLEDINFGLNLLKESYVTEYKNKFENIRGSEIKEILRTYKWQIYPYLNYKDEIVFIVQLIDFEDQNLERDYMFENWRDSMFLPYRDIRIFSRAMVNIASGKVDLVH